MAARDLSGDAAKQVIKHWFSVLSPEDADILKCILQKDLKCGISIKTINKAFGEEFLPDWGVMLAPNTLWNGTLSGPIYMSLKLDGIRGCQGSPGSDLFTRNGHPIQGVDHIKEAIKYYTHRPLDGELMIPGLDHYKTSGLLRSGNKCPEAIYHIFDMPDWPGPFMDRYKALCETIPNDHPHLKVVTHNLTCRADTVWRNFHKAKDAGYEGLVLKNPYAKYQRKRSKDWQKVKAKDSLDLKIEGFIEGEGRLEGTLGAIVVKYKGKLVQVGTGFSDELRDEIWNNPGIYQGRIAEIDYHEVTPDGSLREPRLSKKGIRIDK